jgi:hypothetical protein
VRVARTKGKIRFTTGSRPQKANATWYRGEHCKFSPTVMSMNGPAAVEDYILEGWLPETPFIAPDTKVTAFGSCFARNITDYLNARNYSVLTAGKAKAHIVQFGEGIVNTYAVRGQFDWAFYGVTPKTESWHGWEGQSLAFDEQTRLETRALIDATEVFILTLGLSEIWYDEESGDVFWRAVPAKLFDPARHKFRITSVSENVENILSIYESIWKFRPEAKIIVTLSPIPLVATFRPVSCITANSVSKAILRAAIDEAHRAVAGNGRLFYWPSYEIAMEGFGAGRWLPDRRHVRPEILRYIMQLFETHYCIGSRPEMPLTEARLVAIEAAGEISPLAVAAARAADPEAVADWAEEHLDPDDRETLELLAQCAHEIASESSG